MFANPCSAEADLRRFMIAQDRAEVREKFIDEEIERRTADLMMADWSPDSLAVLAEANDEFTLSTPEVAKFINRGDMIGLGRYVSEFVNAFAESRARKQAADLVNYLAARGSL